MGLFDFFGPSDKEDYDRGYEAGNKEQSASEMMADIITGPLQSAAYCAGHAQGEKDRSTGWA